MENIIFTKGSGSQVSFEEMIKEIINFTKDKKFPYRVMIGTDSEIENNEVDFVSAVVVHRVGFGGKFYYRRWKKRGDSNSGEKFYLIYQRIWDEVLASVDLAQKLVEAFKKYKTNVNFELHVDVGYNGHTKDIIQEVVNYIRTYGLDVKVKPDSFVASKVADRYVI